MAKSWKKDDMSFWSVKAYGKLSGSYGTIIIVVVSVWCSKRGSKVNVVVRDIATHIYIPHTKRRSGVSISMEVEGWNKSYRSQPYG